MKVVKQLSFSDVGTGPIHLANLTSNCPGVIKGAICLITAFDNSDDEITLVFTPSGRSPVTIGKTVTSSTPIAGFYYEMNPIGIYFNTNGSLAVQISTFGNNPITGSVLIIAEIDTFPVS